MNMGEVVAGEVLCGLWNNYSLESRVIAEKPCRKGLGAGARPMFDSTYFAYCSDFKKA